MRTHDPIELVFFPLTPRLPAVVRTARLTPRMIRVTLGGPELDGFSYAMPEDHVKLFFPAPGEELPVMPTIGEDGLEPPPPGSPLPIYRDYTVRHWRPGQRELDIDFVLHGHGPGGSWAAAAQPGDRVGVLGPRGTYTNPLDFDWYLLGADETALPALGAWLERLPADATVHAVVEVADPGERLELAREVQWVYRSEGARLEDGIVKFVAPDGDGYVWIAGEALALKPIRRHVRGFGLPAAHVEVDGYWRRGAVNHDHHDEDD